MYIMIDFIHILRFRYVDADEMSIMVGCKVVAQIQRCFVMCVVVKIVKTRSKTLAFFIHS